MVVQDPRDLKAEEEYLRATAKTEYMQRAEARQRLLELLHYHAHRLQYRKRTEIAVEIVSELEVSRHIQWQGHWRRVDEVGAELRHQHPESFRAIRVSSRNGEEKRFWVFTKAVRLKRYGGKRLVIVHEHEDLTAIPHNFYEYFPPNICENA